MFYYQFRRGSNRYDECCIWSFSSIKRSFYNEKNVWAKYESELAWWHHTRWSTCVSVALLSLIITNLILLHFSHLVTTHPSDAYPTDIPLSISFCSEPFIFNSSYNSFHFTSCFPNIFPLQSLILHILSSLFLLLCYFLHLPSSLLVDADGNNEAQDLMKLFKADKDNSLRPLAKMLSGRL